MQLSRILVPTDFSDAADRAFDQALALARTGVTDVLVLHRLTSAVPTFAPPAQLGAGSFQEVGRLLDDYTRELREEATRKLEHLARRAPKEVHAEFAIEEALEPYEAILSRADDWQADLIVMGTHGRRGLDKLLMGSVASAVLQRAERSMLLLRADSELFSIGPDAGTILVPVDFSDYSQRAVGMARLLAARHGAGLHLLHVVELEQTPLKPGGLSSRFERDPGLREKYLEALRDMLGETPGEVTVGEGTIAGEILWWREKLAARLVVMGSRGLSAWKQLFVGSVAEKVARFSEVPVLIVK